MPNEMVETIGKRYSPKIMAATGQGMLVDEIVAKKDIPIATCYRRLDDLTGAGVIQKQDDTKTHSNRNVLYRRTIDALTIDFQDTIVVRVTETGEAETDVHNQEHDDQGNVQEVGRYDMRFTDNLAQNIRTLGLLSEPTVAKEIAHKIDQALPTTYRRLKTLQNSGLIRKDGKVITQNRRTAETYIRVVDSIRLSFVGGVTFETTKRETGNPELDDVWRDLSEDDEDTANQTTVMMKNSI